ncbi:MAG: hypothetical protein IT181_21110, partial [Acidobacteria bacterium]|nr:hypothetical protein [Acidobacteriota bacterium]
MLVSTTGTASIAGRVVMDDDPGRGIRLATVRLSGAQSVGGQVLVTDDQGNFVATDLPTGR